MGLFGGLFGGGSKFYDPNKKETKNLENEQTRAIKNRSGSGQQVTMQGATSQYRPQFNEANKIRQSFQPTQFSQTYQTGYNVPKFDFKGLSQGYYDTAYNQAAKNIRRDNQGQLTAAKEAVGVRRPGLLASMANNMNRQAGEQLAGTAANLGQERMRLDQDAAIREQLARDDAQRFLAGERGREYESRAGLETRQADENYRNRAAQFDSLMNTMNQQRGITGEERDYQDRGLGMQQEWFGTLSGLQNQRAADQSARRGQVLGTLGGGFGAIMGRPKK